MKFILLVSTLLISILLAGCAGSAARISNQSVEEVYKQNVAGKSLETLCGAVTKIKAKRYSVSNNVFNKANEATDMGFRDYGTTRDYCDDPAAYHYTKTWSLEEYKIDGLLIVVETKRKPPQACHSGNIHRITLQGKIGPDSSFAIEKLVNDATPCSDIEGNVVKHVEVQLESNGGLINDGYLLGRTLKKYSATTIVKNDKVCASSCAVAFLGGEKRIVEDNGTVLFHAPYYNRLNALGKSDPNCAVEGSVLNDMQSYFTEMTNTDISKRLFERTMWYCSADNGWTVTGGNAAKLYGIATE
jgi:ATP-dependent protease ClpP protease subunit|tara:strand:+ start:75 stop:977 length:903 start_codon:yes stop_codon:yes gene_type:complete